jgi:hypothetical protein
VFLIGLASVVMASAQDAVPPVSPTIHSAPVGKPSMEAKQRGVLGIEPVLTHSSELRWNKESSLKYQAMPPQTNGLTSPNLSVPVARPSSPANEELSKKLQGCLGPGFDPEKAHQLIKSAPHSAEAREMLAAIKSAAKPLLHNEPISIDAPKRAEAQKSSMKHGDKVVPRKVPLEPLPAKPSHLLPDCEKTTRLDELRGKAASETNSFTRERLLLDLAGHHVGQNDWHSAKAIYDDLAAQSQDPAVLEAVRNNLRVVDKKLEALAETDPARRERLELELATIHHDLGHEQASKRISEELAQKAADESVRKDAASLLEVPPKPLPPWSAPKGNSLKGGSR